MRLRKVGQMYVLYRCLEVDRVLILITSQARPALPTTQRDVFRCFLYVCVSDKYI